MKSVEHFKYLLQWKPLKQAPSFRLNNKGAKALSGVVGELEVKYASLDVRKFWHNNVQAHIRSEDSAKVKKKRRADYKWDWDGKIAAIDLVLKIKKPSQKLELVYIDCPREGDDEPFPIAMLALLHNTNMPRMNNSSPAVKGTYVWYLSVAPRKYLEKHILGDVPDISTCLLDFVAVLSNANQGNGRFWLHATTDFSGEAKLPEYYSNSCELVNVPESYTIDTKSAFGVKSNNDGRYFMSERDNSVWNARKLDMLRG